MPWHTPERKAEQALKLYLQTVLGYELEGVQITTRFCNETMTEPRAEIYFETAEPWEGDANAYTGNWKLDGAIKVVSHYADGVDAVAHDEIVGNILDKLLLRDDVTGAEAATSEINATQGEEDLTVLLTEIGTRTNSTEGNSMVTEQELVLYVKPSNIGEV